MRAYIIEVRTFIKREEEGLRSSSFTKWGMALYTKCSKRLIVANWDIVVIVTHWEEVGRWICIRAR